MASLLAGRDMSALTIIWLADIAELLTAYTMERTRKAISDILSIGEEFVWRINDDGLEEKVALEYLRQGDRIMVHTGEKISVDGVVESGEAAVDQASMTGEFLPVTKKKADKVFAGTVVKSGRLVIRAEKSATKQPWPESFIWWKRLPTAKPIFKPQPTVFQRISSPLILRLPGLCWR